jgi:hypothetical protein
MSAFMSGSSFAISYCISTHSRPATGEFIRAKVRFKVRNRSELCPANIKDLCGSAPFQLRGKNPALSPDHDRRPGRALKDPPQTKLAKFNTARPPHAS